MTNHHELVMPPRYSQRILRASALALVSIASAIYNKLPTSALLATAVFITSVNYWRHPIFGLRRNVDMGCVCVALGYQIMFMAYEATAAARHAYWAATAFGCCCYLASVYAGRVLHDYNADSILHISLHVCANLGNIMLYDSFGANVLGLGLRH